MPTNQTHDELIKSKFIEKFRNPLRNYYTYGFMNYSMLPEKKKTLDEDWVRLTNILQENKYFEWSSDRKLIAFITGDSQSQECNPFHRVYRFSMFGYNDLIIFFNTIFALSPFYEPTERLFSFAEKVPEERRKSYGEDMLEFGSAYILPRCLFSVSDESLPEMTAITEKRYNEVRSDLSHSSLIDRFFENLSKGVLTYQQLGTFCESNIDFLKEDQNIRKYLDSIKSIRFLHETSADKRNVKWELSCSTLHCFMEQCGNEKESFLDAIDFFSRYFVLGEFGVYILSRINRGNESVFRFKHEYFAQALNDYILIDILKAIEKKYWCKLTHSNPLNRSECSLICYPLQIRISQTNGREYLVIYVPHNHSYSSIRIDLISKLEFVKDIKMGAEEISLAMPWVRSEIVNAKVNIESSWGVSTTDEQENNAKSPVIPKEVKLWIKYDPETEYYILNRLQRERRYGKIKVDHDIIEFTISVSDPGEMRPWVRSLYTRILDYSGFDIDIFNLAVDTYSYKKMDHIYDGLKTDTSSNVNWFIPEEYTYSIINDYDRDAIFSKFFGSYFMAFGDALSSIYEFNNEGKDYLSEAEFRECVRSVCERRSRELGSNSRRALFSPNSSFNIFSALATNRFVRRGCFSDGKWVDSSSDEKNNYLYYRKYRSLLNSKIDLYYSVVPLSAWELRWLYTILQDEKMKLFLSSDTIESLCSLIPSGIKPINMSDIKVFDRYHSRQYMVNSDTFRLIMFAIHNSEALHISYRSGKGNNIKGCYCPIHIEYSKRDDRFRVFLMCQTTKKIVVMNLERIKNIRKAGNVFNMEECKYALAKYLKNNSKSITIEFKDTRNIPDRILNEFSPWRKRCELIDDDRKIYRLTIYYLENDEIDILIRLMGYGPYIRFLDKEHTIYKGIMDRIDQQLELFRSKEKDR